LTVFNKRFALVAGLLTSVATVVPLGVAVWRAVDKPPKPETLPACWVVPVAEETSGYVWVTSAGSRRKNPPVSASCNTRRGDNTVVREHVGTYRVRFPGVGTPGGIVHVTPAGDGAHFCRAVDWAPDAKRRSDEIVRIRCTDGNAVPVDSGFAARFLHRRAASGVMGYVRADQPTAASYLPDGTRQFNSAGGMVVVNRQRIGRYVVAFVSLTSVMESGRGGVATVTAAGPGAGSCNPVRWAPPVKDSDPPQVLLEVECRSLRGRLMDSAFVASYSVALGSRPEERVPGAHLWAEHAEKSTEYYPTPIISITGTGSRDRSGGWAEGSICCGIRGSTETGEWRNCRPTVPRPRVRCGR
jgi:hypothetical protein